MLTSYHGTVSSKLRLCNRGSSPAATRLVGKKRSRRVKRGKAKDVYCVVEELAVGGLVISHGVRTTRAKQHAEHTVGNDVSLMRVM